MRGSPNGKERNFIYVNIVEHTYRCTELVERMQCRQRHRPANVHADSIATCVRPYSFFQLLKYSTMDYRRQRKVAIEFWIRDFVCVLCVNGWKVVF